MGAGAEGKWPKGVEKGALVFKRDALSCFAGTSADRGAVSVSVLDAVAAESVVADFLDSAFRTNGAPAEERPGCITVYEVGSMGRWALHSPVLGLLSDLSALGWKLKRKLQFFGALCKLVGRLHEAGGAHGAITPWAVGLDEAMGPVLGSATGLALWDTGGHLEYLVPELLLGAAPTQRSDIYCLGRLLAFLITGEHPPPEKDAVPRLDHLKEAPAGLVRIIRRATLGNPDLRYDDVEQLLMEVENYGDFEKVGLALATAVELNKTTMSRPPQAIARPRPKDEDDKPKAAPPRFGQKPTAEEPNRTRGLAVLLALFTITTLATFGGPLLHGYRSWQARGAFKAASPQEKGQMLAQLAALGDREHPQLPLSGADLSGCALSGVNLSGGDLSNAKLDNADLGGSNLSNVNLANASALGTIFAEADVSDARQLETVACDARTIPPPAWTCADGHLALDR